MEKTHRKEQDTWNWFIIAIPWKQHRNTFDGLVSYGKSAGNHQFSHEKYRAFQFPGKNHLQPIHRHVIHHKCCCSRWSLCTLAAAAEDPNPWGGEFEAQRAEANRTTWACPWLHHHVPSKERAESVISGWNPNAIHQVLYWWRLVDMKSVIHQSSGYFMIFYGDFVTKSH